MEPLDAKLCDFGGSGIDGSGLLAWGMLPFYRLVDRKDCTEAQRARRYIGIRDAHAKHYGCECSGIQDRT